MNYKMMELFPKVRTDFFSIVSSKFPHIKWDKAQIIHYTEQSFKVLDYLPSMRKQLFEIVIDKCLEIDVNIKIKDNGDVLIEEQQKNNGENSQEQRPGVTKEEEKKNNVDEFSDKLDSLLALLLDEIRKSSKDGLSSREMYYELLPMFESTILTTHKAKYVQFCIFYACGLESELLEDESDAMQDFLHAILHRDFAAKLLETIIDPYRATLTRQSGACYLASFISRASFVGPDTICESISVLLRWAEAYIESVGQYAIRSTDSREQSELHSLFYTVCQAAFYIMCFRGTEAVDFYKTIVAGYSSMVESGDGHSDFPDPEQIDLSTKRWTFICTHDLQPLRYCLESVRSEFLHIAHAFELIEEDKLDKLVDDAKRLSTGRVNKRAASKISTFVTLSVRRQKGGVGGLGRGSNPLKSFFPFDPLLLRRCYDFLEPYYRHWQGPVEEEDVLSIDDGSVDESSGDDEEIFELDGDDSRQRIPAVVSDPETKNNITTDKNDANNEDDNYDDDDDHEENSFGMRTPDVHKKKEIQRKAWSEATKRPRSLSMENGSW
jgi:RNA polymerase I-specific transcription initiation factor RRN3